VKGEIIEGWKFDTYAQEGLTGFENYGGGNFSKTNLGKGLNVVKNSAGVPVCASEDVTSRRIVYRRIGVVNWKGGVKWSVDWLWRIPA
jgi:hypothetical protein